MKFKTSTLCAGVSLLAVGGFMVANLAGCGGGGGGGLGGTPISTSAPLTATFIVTNPDGSVAAGGTVTLTSSGVTISSTIDPANGKAIFSNLKAGFYDLAVTTRTSNASGATIVDQFFQPGFSITDSGLSGQVVFAVSDPKNAAYVITGTVRLNNSEFPPVTSPSSSVAACDTTSAPVTSAVMISVRELSGAAGNPIIAQKVRVDQGSGGNGAYSISVPNRPNTIQVSVSQATSNGEVFAGQSPSATFPTASTTLSNINICANPNSTVPGPAPTATLTSPTPTYSTGTPVPTTSATATPTASPVPTSG